MPIYVSLLRGINVGGNKKIKMAELRALYQSLGMTSVQSVLQSGNVLFQSHLTDCAAIIHQLESGIEQQFGFHADVLLRTVDEFKDVVNQNPLVDGDVEPSKLIVMFLAESPTDDAIGVLAEAHDGPETIRVLGRDVYLYYPNGLGRSRLTNVFIERKLNVSGTARNWNTINKLIDLLDQFEVP